MFTPAAATRYHSRMPLATGTKLGPYEILEPIGAGGMGEVYKAHDSRLDRTVAIKVLPAHLSQTPESRARFDREAKAVSSLNHPNICVLYDVGHDQNIDYLVMEYIEGETLADRIDKGSLDTQEVIRIAIEIANALDTAHHAGIIHRDLKPGNVMLTKSGAKLLDFGLARSTASDHSHTDLSQSPTLSRPLTAEGAIVGTFQYMSPEQLEGAEADARTDIFAFGAVLYEMVTGHKAFAGQTQASLIASILKEEPRPITQVQPLTPPALERVVQRCLAKDPDQRWQTARDLMLELQWVRDGGSQASIPAPVRARRKHRETLAWALATVLAVVVAVTGIPRLFEKSAPVEVSRFALLAPEGAQLRTGQVMSAVSPDGRHVCFMATDSLGVSQIYVRVFESRVARPVPGTQRGYMPFWSPDSRSIGFFTADGNLARIKLGEGTVQVICQAADGRGATWGSKDVIVFNPASGGPLFAVSAHGGEVRQVTELDKESGEEAHRWPNFLPDGEHFTYASLPVRDGLFSTWIGAVGAPTREFVVKADGGAIYAEPGYMLFERDQAIAAQPFDARGRKLSGSARPIGELPGDASGWSGSPCVSASTNGVLLRSESSPPSTDLIWLDRTGRRTGQLALESGGFYSDPSISPDGRRVAVSETVRGSSGFDANIWTVDLSRNLSTRFTFNPSENFLPEWSPDSRFIVWVSDRSGNENIYIKASDGTGEDRPLVQGAALFTKPTAFSPDGEYLVYNTLTQETGFDIWLLPMTGDEREPRKFLATRFNEYDAVVSPDGNWIAYRSDESGRFEVYVQRFPEGGDKYRVSARGAGTYGTEGSLLGFADDEVIFRAPDEVTVMSARVSAEPEFHAEAPRTLFRLPQGTVSATMAPGGERFLAVVPTGGQTPAMYVVTNWSAALEQ